MRVITGSARGTHLFTPKGDRIRPTADRIKEALFSILGGRTREAIFVDGFAGIGSMGIEALSRGADKCFFIDNHKESIDMITKNLHKTNLIDKAEIIHKDIQSAIKTVAMHVEKVDIIFLDPPYLKGLITSSLEAIVKNNILHSDSWIIFEHDKTEIHQEEISGLVCFRQQTYGNTTLSFYKKGGTTE
ncbi:16S rRNA (guanine(966)-N(2))-methyltransferase RsmD [Irregularibacter muris]|uniref:16S rRNA (Guanine(966)-N(2))-methyltransferase RsmD n=1 Tax=Irregularibacter muris TaxID=1796619 RepID=A0AAE3KZE0_9FIRM|nr:16S rRNA (guanine(966)-N(2))-methyltransferase RsmD [Irregularibacter muris]MCR1898157.1 16S rRNA (guanine(966)-N(2))-methyltransferase RsmD [Irregularibacter muris]